MLAGTSARTWGRAALACALFLIAAPGFAIDCGETLPPGNYDMDADLDCDLPRGEPSLRLSDGATLDMHHYTLTCHSDPATGGGDGIWLEGSFNQLSNGNVEGCGVAVLITGGSSNRVSRMNVDGYREVISVNGTANLVRDVIASGGIVGFEVSNDDNVLRRNQSLSAANVGFQMDANRTRLSHNTAVSSACIGFAVRGDDTVLTDNESIAAMHARDYCSANFLVYGQRNRLERNVARAGSTDGFRIEFAQAITMRHNLAVGNALAGIHVVEGSTANRVVENIAVGDGLWDLEDDNADCADDVWSRNVFGTANTRCTWGLPRPAR
jgi:hypothetical protein